MSETKRSSKVKKSRMGIDREENCDHELIEEEEVNRPNKSKMTLEWTTTRKVCGRGAELKGILFWQVAVLWPGFPAP